MRPSENDYAPFYSGYLKNVADDVMKQLKDQLHSTYEFLKLIPEDNSEFRYAEGKWSIKEVVGHLIDAERIFSYRALAISRGEEVSLPGWDEKIYTGNGNFNNRKFSDLIDELRILREANLLHFRNFNEETLDKRGTANDTVVSIRAILFIIAGHEAHHIRVLKEKYLGNPDFNSKG